MVAHFDKFLAKHIRVNQHQSVVELEGNSQLAVFNVFKRVKQNVVSVFIISKFLLLLCDGDSNLNCLTDLSGLFVQPESVLWFFGDTISFTHKVIDQLMRKCVKFDLGNHFNHFWNSALAILDVKFQSFAVLVRLFVMTGGITPLGFTFVKLGNL